MRTLNDQDLSAISGGAAARYDLDCLYLPQPDLLFDPAGPCPPAPEPETDVMEICLDPTPAAGGA